LYAEFDRLARRLDVRTWRPAMLDTVVAWVERRLAADSLDAFAVLMLNEAFVKAQVAGSIPDSEPRRVARIEMAIAVAQRRLPAGAIAAERTYGPWLLAATATADLAQQLGASLAGAVARERERSAAARP